VDNVGYRGIGGRGLDDRQDAGNTARFNSRHNTSPPEKSEPWTPNIVDSEKDDDQNCRQGSEHVSPRESGAPDREPVGSLGIPHHDGKSGEVDHRAMPEALGS
jgi:hypothetical protein